MTQFQTATYRGFEVQITGLVKDNYDIVYLEMAGAEAEVRAIWAKLVSADMKKSGYVSTVKIDGRDARMEKHTKYITIRAALPDGQHTIALLHPRATIIEPSALFYIVDKADREGPPPAFFSRLAQALPVPVKEEWAGWLWTRGLEYGQYNRLIKKLDSRGHVAGYEVKAHDIYAWLTVIRRELGLEGGDDPNWSPNTEKEGG